MAEQDKQHKIDWKAELALIDEALSHETGIAAPRTWQSLNRFKTLLEIHLLIRERIRDEKMLDAQLFGEHLKAAIDRFTVRIEAKRNDDHRVADAVAKIHDDTGEPVEEIEARLGEMTGEELSAVLGDES